MTFQNFPEPVSYSVDDVYKYLTDKPTGITFIHGKAGCGKTTLIGKIVSTVDGCQVLTPTNLSAGLYGAARTIHSFFYGVFDDLEDGIQDPRNVTPDKIFSCQKKVRDLKLLVIDEISMVRADLLEMINTICQKGKASRKPFGGIPVVFVGDLFQLPPIVSDDAVLEFLEKEYNGIYFYDSHVVKENLKDIKLFELTKSFRQQNDAKYSELLDSFRKPLGPGEKVDLLNALNSRVTRDIPLDAIYIASSNEEVRKVNTERLRNLPGETYVHPAKFNILKKDRSDHVEITADELPCQEDVFPIVLPSAYDSHLTFKIGARVVFTKSSKGYFANGEFGTILDYDDETGFTIETDSDSITTCPSPRYPESQLIDYRYEMEYDAKSHKLIKKKPYIQKTMQFPIKLAYAFTIHKAQGQTYDKVILDLNSHIFAPGQLYVALSRVRSLEDLYLTKPIVYSDIISDQSVFSFLAELRTINQKSFFKPAKVPIAPAPIYNQTASNFATFIKNNERNNSTKVFLLHTLDSYKILLAQKEYDKAFMELQKIVDLIVNSYQSSNFSDMLNCVRENKHSEECCQFALNAIFEIYTSVVRLPLSQYHTDTHALGYRIS